MVALAQRSHSKYAAFSWSSGQLEADSAAAWGAADRAPARTSTVAGGGGSVEPTACVNATAKATTATVAAMEGSSHLRIAPRRRRRGWARDGVIGTLLGQARVHSRE